MLESEGVQTSSLQKIRTLGDSNPTPVFIGIAQRNPSPPDNNQIPVAKDPVHISPTKICQLLARKRVHILAS
jgi:hypothetical protein